MPWISSLLSDKSYLENTYPTSNGKFENNRHAPAWRIMSSVNTRMGLDSVVCWLSNSATTLFDPCCMRDERWLPFVWKQPLSFRSIVVIEPYANSCTARAQCTTIMESWNNGCSDLLGTWSHNYFRLLLSENASYFIIYV